MNQAVGIKDLLDANPINGPARSGARRFWTCREENILREKYAAGLDACIAALPGRSASSIYQAAARLGLKGLGRSHDFRTQRWTSNDQIDAAITRAYQSTPTKGAIFKLAQTLNRPRWWVSKRATKLGLKSPRFKELPWAEEEIEFVCANAHKDPDVIARLLRSRGFQRSATAITVKLKRQGIATGRNADIDHYTATSLSKCFGIDAKGVTAWIAKGWLKAEKRGTARTEQQGGDENWIHRRDVRRFVIENVAAVDLRKVEKFWFIELLTGAQS